MADDIGSHLFRSEKISKLYHESRPNYEDTEIIEKILDFLSLSFEKPYHKAADIGCGTGLSTRILAPHFKEVFGIDASYSQIEEAKRVNTEDSLIFCIGKAEDLSMIPNESLQLLTVGTAIHYFEDDAFLQEVDRVLKPGGCFVQYCYSNYYDQPGELNFDVENDQTRQMVLKKCNGLLLEVFRKAYEQNGYEQLCSKKEVEGLMPKYEDVVRCTVDCKPRYNVDSLFTFLQTLGSFQYYFRESNTNGAEFIAGYKRRFVEILKEITDEPQSFDMHFSMRTFMILARKPMTSQNSV